jgi:hypothetical protein
MVFVHTIYLLQTREFIGTNVFKIGRTYNIINRFSNYPKNSVLLYFSSCTNSVVIEYKIKVLFINKYKQRKDIGSEYFEGDYNNMLSDIKTIILHDIPLPISDTKSIQDDLWLEKYKIKNSKRDQVQQDQVQRNQVQDQVQRNQVQRNQVQDQVQQDQVQQDQVQQDQVQQDQVQQDQVQQDQVQQDQVNNKTPEIKCEYCDKLFSNVYTLNTHKQTSKSCIRLREENGLKVENIVNFECLFCNKHFTSNKHVIRHHDTCKTKSVVEKIQEEHNINIKTLKQIHNII